MAVASYVAIDEFACVAIEQIVIKYCDVGTGDIAVAVHVAIDGTRLGHCYSNHGKHCNNWKYFFHIVGFIGFRAQK